MQAAWANPAADLDTAEVPSHAAQSTTYRALPSATPGASSQSSTFTTAWPSCAADDLIGFAETVRELTQGEKLTGGFFGYVMELAWNMCFFADNTRLDEAEVSTVQRSGHLGLHQLMRSPAVDFLVSPYGYAFRGLGGDCLPMQPDRDLRTTARCTSWKKTR